MTVTTEEVLAALRDFRAPGKRPAGAFTVAEAALELGLTDRTVLNILHKIQRAGRLELVRFQSKRLDGRTTTTTGYRITSGKAKAVR